MIFTAYSRTRWRFFPAYSVHVGDFLPHISTRSIIFAAQSVGMEYFLAHTQSAEKNQNGEQQPNNSHKSISCFSPQVTYPDGTAQYN